MELILNFLLMLFISEDILIPIKPHTSSLTSFLTSSLMRLYVEQVFPDKLSLTGFICFCVCEI